MYSEADVKYFGGKLFAINTSKKYYTKNRALRSQVCDLLLRNYLDLVYVSYILGITLTVKNIWKY